MQDATLAHEVQLYESVIEGIRDFERDRLKKRLQELEGTKYGNQDEFRTSKRSYVKLSIAGLFFIIAITSFLMPSKNAGEIFNKHFESYPNVIYVPENDDSTDSPYRRAFTLYEQENFEEAIKVFKYLERNGTDRIGIPFYLAMSYLHQGQHDLAIPKFFSLAQMDEHDFTEPVHWYLSLALIKENEFKAAKQQLGKLATYDNPYRKEAIKLIKKL